MAWMRNSRAVATTRSGVEELRSELLRLRAEVARQSGEIAVLRTMAHEDPLTGLLNRRGFEHDLVRAISYSGRYRTPVALLVADLDGFKPVNDRHGHAAGDAVLQHVADVFRTNLRASDSIGRLGGDEFALLLWQVDEAFACRKARALEAILLGASCPWQGRSLTVAISIGTTILNPADDVGSALGRADAAMYGRKRNVIALTR